MIPGLTLGSSAFADIESAVRWMKERDEVRARKFLQAVQDSLQILVQSSYLGSPRAYPVPAMHSLRRYQLPGFRDCGIFYRPLASGNGVVVFRVLHARQDDFARLEESLEDFD